MSTKPETDHKTTTHVIVNRLGPSGPETPFEEWMRENLGDENTTVVVNGIAGPAGPRLSRQGKGCKR